MLVAKKDIYDNYYDKPTIKKTNTVIDTRRKKESNVALKIKAFLYALAMLIICLTILFRYTYITKVQIEISQLNNEINKLSEEKQELALELDELKDTRWIERQAMTKLNMRYPNDGEKFYVSVDKNILNNKETGQNTASIFEGKKVFLESFRNMFKRIANAI